MSAFATKIIGMALFVALATGISAAQSREVRRTVDFNPGGELRVSTDRSRVQLTAWERNAIEVYARIVKPEQADSDFDPRAIELTRIDVIGDARALTIRTNFDDVPYRNGQRWNGRSLPDIYLEVRAPRSLNLTLDADRGEVAVRGLEGRLALTTDRTSIKAEDLAGELRVQMDRGAATVSNVQAKLNFQSDRTNAKLLSTRFTGDSQLEVDRGEIEISLLTAQGLYVSANRGRRAGFESDFAVNNRSASEDRIEGEINGGGPRLTIRTDRGKARLKQQ